MSFFKKAFGSKKWSFVIQRNYFEGNLTLENAALVLTTGTNRVPIPYGAIQELRWSEIEEKSAYGIKKVRAIGILGLGIAGNEPFFIFIDGNMMEDIFSAISNSVKIICEKILKDI